MSKYLAIFTVTLFLSAPVQAKIPSSTQRQFCNTSFYREAKRKFQKYCTKANLTHASNALIGLTMMGNTVTKPGVKYDMQELVLTAIMIGSIFYNCTMVEDHIKNHKCLSVIILTEELDNLWKRGGKAAMSGARSH